MNKDNTEVTDTSKPAFSLCVYCGSRTGAQPEFAAIAAPVSYTHLTLPTKRIV